MVGKIHQPIKAKMYEGNDLSLGKGYTFWQNEANKCVLLAVKKPYTQTWIMIPIADFYASANNRHKKIDNRLREPASA